MSCALAYRKCPQAIFVRSNFEKYRTASQQIRDVFKRYTDLIEPMSLDEAYLDVTDNGHGLYATEIAKRIKKEIQQETLLTGSAGVAPNKLLAKIASDVNKPDGLTVVRPNQAREFMGKAKRFKDIDTGVFKGRGAVPLNRKEGLLLFDSLRFGGFPDLTLPLGTC